MLCANAAVMFYDVLFHWSELLLMLFVRFRCAAAFHLSSQAPTKRDFRGVPLLFAFLCITHMLTFYVTLVDISLQKLMVL